MTSNKMRFLNMMQNVKVKKEKLDDDDNDAVHCKLCAKGFASNMALMNHAKVEHIAEYVAGEDLCMGPPQPKLSNKTKAQQREAAKQQIKRKTQELISSMSPTNLMSFASPDVSYIIIKTEDDAEPEAKRRKERTVKKKEKQENDKIIVKKDREPLPISCPQSSQGSQNIIETGHNQDLKTNNPNYKLNNKKKEYQRKYREQNREKLKQREAERRIRLQCLQYPFMIAGASASDAHASIDNNDMNNQESTTNSEISILRKQLSMPRNADDIKKDALKRKKEQHRRYRERNREKLKQRERERRARMHYKEMMTESTSNSEFSAVINEPGDEFSVVKNEPEVEFSVVKNDPEDEFSVVKNELEDELSIVKNEPENEISVVKHEPDYEMSTNSPSKGLGVLPVIVNVFQINERGLKILRENTTEIRNNYSQFIRHRTAHYFFRRNFTNNEFGHACSICDRLWFEKDLRKCPPGNIIDTITDVQNVDELKVCLSCKSALDKNLIPNLSVYNGFHYPKIPEHLPEIDLISERFVSPRIPFTQIRRLRHFDGQVGIYGQVINVPVADTVVKTLPRNVNDEHCIYVNIGKKLIHKNAQGLNVETIRQWLDYLINTPLYKHYKIKVDESYFDQNVIQHNIDEFSENIDVDERCAQEQTLVWDEEKYLKKERDDIPSFDDHAEELSFPSIYLGQFRTVRDTARLSPFMMTSSELRRKDRRGVIPCHLLYMAEKMMRLRIHDCLTTAFKNLGKDITKEQVESEDYLHNWMESNFLRLIPNSVWYWSERKNDLFALIRQLGRPTAIMTLHANEIGWPDLLKLLHKLGQGDMENFNASELSFIQRSTLVNNDAVTCALYFNKLVKVIIKSIQLKKFSPFGRYRVINYFLRIGFEHGSSQAHILLWLDNAPDILREEKKVIEMIDSLISVSKLEASGCIELVTHKHDFKCYKQGSTEEQNCRFGPFMPCKSTMILKPMDTMNPVYKKRYYEVRMNLENNDYSSIDDYYASNKIRSDEEYKDILRSVISRPTIFIKRAPSEKWHNAFNPFVLNVLKSNMNFQIITDEYDCATYIVECVNKSNRGISDLQRKLKEVVNKNPEFDITDITRNISVDILNAAEMSTQEAAWYLLRLPMSISADPIQYIDTRWPKERLRIQKAPKQVDDDSTDIRKEDWYDKYQKRPKELEGVTLAQFVSMYTRNNNGKYLKRPQPQVIRYRNYDMSLDYKQYRREMVTLHIPFRDEVKDILADMKFTNIYYDHEIEILERRKEFESDLDIHKIIDICRRLCRKDANDESENVTRSPEPNPFEEVYVKSELE